MCDILIVKGGRYIVSDKAKEREKQIKKLQQNLSSIRKIAGWTAEVLGDKTNHQQS